MADSRDTSDASGDSIVDIQKRFFYFLRGTTLEQHGKDWKIEIIEGQTPSDPLVVQQGRYKLSLGIAYEQPSYDNEVWHVDIKNEPALRGWEAQLWGFHEGKIVVTAYDMTIPANRGSGWDGDWVMVNDFKLTEGIVEILVIANIALTFCDGAYSCEERLETNRNLRYWLKVVPLILSNEE